MKTRINPWHVSILCGFLITIFLFWTYFYVSYNLKQEQVLSLEYDTVWSATNGRIEFYKYSSSVSRYLNTGNPADLEDAQVRYEILLGRMETWNSGNFSTFLKSAAGLTSDYKQLSEKLEALSPLMQGLQRSDADDLQRALEDIAPIIELISSKSYQSSIKRFSGERLEFRQRLLTERRIVIGLLVLATLLMAFVMRQNWTLTQANSKIAGDADKLAYMAKHDGLTKLPNRTLLDEHLTRARTRLKAGEAVHAIALDLDGFKAVNDTLGHGGGDALLAAVARRLNSFVSGLPGDGLAARIGGDEFLVFLWCRSDEIDIEASVQSLVTAFTTPLETSIGSLLVGTSIGYAVASETDEVDYVVLNADLALTEAKAAGRGTATRFAPSMRAQLERRLQIERELPNALKNQLITPHYQLQFNLFTSEPVGMEALARWNHGDIGFVSPAEFIPIAEATGDIVTLGSMMLRAACEDVQRLPETIKVSVNLSMIQLLNDDLLGLVAATLRETGLSPARLKLEVTESVVMHNVDAVAKLLGELQELGVTISLDDFGTGYSALSYLNNFRWDELKIDRSFVTACETSPKALNTVNVIKSLADKMNADLLIEGLETQAQVETFQSLGCVYGQGFFYNRPAPIEQVLKYFDRHGYQREPETAVNAGAHI
ncbi:putative bifunctional diguanylate cyclase/phosphodiesterase [Roseibium sp. SCP14]|uniref:putative bifunctional diguanylate cyclase/phosphodiesterase n=1 Tax=Roseibium sp. SCP14 TaxID=3141375 RepID=UPI00333B9104